MRATKVLPLCRDQRVQSDQVQGEVPAHGSRASQELSPRTYEDANDLVHFVDSLEGKDDPSFEDVEAALPSFVLVKRVKSKFNPASAYLSNLITDIELFVGANFIVAQAEIAHAKGDLDAVRPILERMKNSWQALEEALETVEEQGPGSASTMTRRTLTEALDRVGQSLPGVAQVQIPSYPGLLNLWDYTRDVRKALITSLDMAVKLAEDEARVITSAGVQEVHTLGDEYLPEGVERSRRVCMPEAMFSLVVHATASVGSAAIVPLLLAVRSTSALVSRW